MNPVRTALLVLGMGLVLVAGAVAYYQTDLRNNVPVGIFVAVELLIAGLFVMALASEYRRSLVVDRPAVHTEHEHTVVRDRPVRRRRIDTIHDDEVVEEHVETRRVH